MKINDIYTRLLLTFLLIAFFTACRTRKNQHIVQQANYLTAKEDEFSFVVFDKAKLDTFFKKYNPIQANNNAIRKSFETMAKEANSPISPDSLHIRNTRQPTTDDYALAIKILSSLKGKDNSQYFNDGVNYLLFYECLPAEFHQKWPQTQLGDYEVNATFFKLLRENCKAFNDIIYGNTGYWDKNLVANFQYEVFNEITPMTAEAIKACITGNKVFDDISFHQDKAMFISFLDKVIMGKWRMLLLDWN